METGKPATSGQMTFEGEKLNDSGLWQYLHKGLVTNIEGKAIVPFTGDKKGRVTIRLEQAIPPGASLVTIRGAQTSLLWKNNKVQEEATRVTNTIAMVFQVMADNMWVFAAKIINPNGTDIDLLIIHLPEAQVTYYSILQATAAVKAFGKHMLN